MAERAEAPKATEKLTLLLSLVPYLIDQVRVTVDEAAAHFGISPERVKKAVELIAMSGAPGPDGSYTHETLFDIDWDDFDERGVIRFRAAPMEDIPRFSGREAAALLAGLQRVASLPGFADRVDVAALIAKLGRGASSEPSSLAVRATELDARRSQISEALTAGQRLRIDYVTTRGDRELRDVDPIRFDGVDDVWYLQAWCLTRGAERTFRLDRIANAEIIGAAEVHDTDPVDPDTLFRAGSHDQRVTLVVALAGLPLIADYLGPDDPVRVEGNRVTVTLPIAHSGILGRIAARVAGGVEIIDPPEARTAVAAWARAALEASEG